MESFFVVQINLVGAKGCGAPVMSAKIKSLEEFNDIVSGFFDEKNEKAMKMLGDIECITASISITRVE